MKLHNHSKFTSVRKANSLVIKKNNKKHTHIHLCEQDNTLSTLSGSLKSTNPKPLDRPVMGSSFNVQSTTSPNFEK